MVMIAAGIQATGAAIEGRKNRAAAEKARKAAEAIAREASTRDTTSSRDPYAPAKPFIDDSFNLIHDEYLRGANQLATAGRGGGRGGGGGASQGNVVTQGGVQGVVGKGGKFQPLGKAAQGRGAGGGTGPGPMGADATMRDLMNTAHNDVNSPPQLERDANAYGHDVLTGGTDEDPFGANPILNDLYGRLDGANFDRSQNLLEGFLGGRYGSKGGAGGGSGDGMVPGGSMGWSSAGASVGAGERQAGYHGPGPGGSSSYDIPDTMDDDSSWVVQQIKALYDPSHLNPADDPTLAPYIAAMERDAQKSLTDQLGDIGDEAEGANMYGGSGFQIERGRARGDSEAGLADARARTYFNSRQDALNRREHGLDVASGRDLAAMQDRTQRYGIDSASASSRAGAGAAADAENRRIDLQAIGMLGGNDQFGLSMLGDLGGQLSSDQRFAANDLTGTMAGIRGNRLGQAFDMAQGVSSVDRANAAQKAAAARARAMAPGQDLDDYLRRLNGAAAPYGTSSEHESVVDPSRALGSGTFANRPGGSDLGAALAGVAQGLGAWGQGGGWGGGSSGGNAAPSGGGGNTKPAKQPWW